MAKVWIKKSKAIPNVEVANGTDQTAERAGLEYNGISSLVYWAGLGMKRVKGKLFKHNILGELMSKFQEKFII